MKAVKLTAYCCYLFLCAVVLSVTIMGFLILRLVPYSSNWIHIYQANLASRSVLQSLLSHLDIKSEWFQFHPSQYRMVFALIEIERRQILKQAHINSKQSSTKGSKRCDITGRKQYDVLLDTQRLNPFSRYPLTNVGSNVQEEGIMPMDQEMMIKLSQNPNITARGKWQMKQINKYCQKYSQQELSHTLPENHFVRRNLFRHILFDDQRKLLFCFIPKVGCTNMRRLWLLLQNLIPLETVYWRHVSEAKYLKPGVKKIFFDRDDLTDNERLHKIRTYWKFVMVRHPLERLLSAYLNKLSKPLNTSLGLTDTFEITKLTILLQYQPQLIRNWITNPLQLHNLTVDFETYIRWIVDTPNHELNEHFAPMVEIAQPCRVRYQFYGNFKMYSSEVNNILRKFNIPRSYFNDKPYHERKRTATLMRKFYCRVEMNLKRELFTDYYEELDFYYTLYPEERHSHIKLLGVPCNTDISSMW